MSATITIDHNGTSYPGRVMTIKSTMFGTEDHGILSAFLHCEGKGFGVGVGGYGLDAPVKVHGKFSHREGTAYGLDHLAKLMETVGVHKWEDLPGKHVIVLSEPTSGGGWGSQSVGIADITGERVMVLKEHAEDWKASHVSDEEVSA